MTSDALVMGASGLAVSALAPGAVLACRQAAVWRRLSLPAAAALPLLWVLHAGVTLGESMARPAPAARWLLEAALAAGAVVFWLPVVGPRRLDGAGRCLYLFLAAPVLDLPAVAMIAMGDTAGGLAMIVGMLPIGIAAMAATWQWVQEEERQAAAESSAARETG